MTHLYPLMLNDLTNIFIFNRQWLVDNNSTADRDAAKNIEGHATHHANGTGPSRWKHRAGRVATQGQAPPQPDHN